MEPGFPGDSWTPDCPWEAMDKFLTLLSCVASALPIELAYFYLSPWFFSPFPSASLPHSTDGMTKQVWGAELSVRVNSKEPPQKPNFPCLFNYILKLPLISTSLLSQKSDVATRDLPMSNRSFIIIFYFLLEKDSIICLHKKKSFLRVKVIICHDFYIPFAYRNTNYLVTHLTILPNIFTYKCGWRYNREKWFILMTTIQH